MTDREADGDEEERSPATRQGPTRDLPRNEPPQTGGRGGHQLSLISEFSGPLPPSAEFAAYNDGTPDAADRILRMAEQSLQHRAEMDRAESKRADEELAMDQRGMDADERVVTRSQWMSFSLLGTSPVVAVVALLVDYPWVAGAVGGLAFVGAVASLLGQRVRPERPASESSNQLEQRARHSKDEDEQGTR